MLNGKSGKISGFMQSLSVLICGYIFLGLFFSGCAGESGNIKVTGSDGGRLYRAKCGSCHRLMSPSEHNADKWAEYVEKYGNKIRLTDEEKQNILDYLTSP